MKMFRSSVVTELHLISQRDRIVTDSNLAKQIFWQAERMHQNYFNDNISLTFRFLELVIYCSWLRFYIMSYFNAARSLFLCFSARPLPNLTKSGACTPLKMLVIVAYPNHCCKQKSSLLTETSGVLRPLRGTAIAYKKFQKTFISAHFFHYTLYYKNWPISTLLTKKKFKFDSARAALRAALAPLEIILCSLPDYKVGKGWFSTHDCNEFENNTFTMDKDFELYYIRLTMPPGRQRLHKCKPHFYLWTNWYCHVSYDFHQCHPSSNGCKCFWFNHDWPSWFASSAIIRLSISDDVCWWPKLAWNYFWWV